GHLEETWPGQACDSRDNQNHGRGVAARQNRRAACLRSRKPPVMMRLPRHPTSHPDRRALLIQIVAVHSAIPYDSRPHGYCGPGGTQWRHLLSEQATSSHLEQTTCIDVGPVSSYSLCQLYLESSFHEPLSPQSSGG